MDSRQEAHDYLGRLSKKDLQDIARLDDLGVAGTKDDLRRVLALAQAGSPSCVLDDGAALHSSGDTTTMRALRLLLREELTLLQHDLDELSRDGTAFADRLHRLRSSCGFCGATALANQTIQLQQQLSSRDTAPAALHRFRSALQATLQALD